MIKFTTIDANEVQIERTFNTFEDISKDWYSDECTLPILDDALVYAEVDGKVVKGNIFEDLIKYLGLE